MVFENPRAVLVAVPNLEIEIKDRHGRLLDVIKTHNIVTSKGITNLRNLVGYPAVAGDGFTPKFIAIGSDGQAPALTDTGLFGEVLRKAFVRRVAEGSDTIHYQAFIDTTEANGSGTQPLRESAIYAVQAGGYAWTRAIHTLINKTVSISITYNWRLTFANAVSV